MSASRAFRPLGQAFRPSVAAHARVGLSTTVRQASTSGPAGTARRFVKTTILLASGAAFLAYHYDSRSMLHDKIAMPFIRLLDAEDSHKLAIKMLGNWWIRPRDKGVDGPELQAELFGLPISNPIGMAAGFDKDGDAIDGLFDLGFGYVEVGSVTPVSQPGNPKPRFFRLTEDDAAINRYGFNSLGHAHMLASLRARVRDFSRSHPSLFPPPTKGSIPLPPSGLPRSLRPGHLLAVNLGKNKTSPADSNDDYIRGVRLLGPYADVVVINVSSPNTPGLRALQGREVLEKLLTDVVEERNKIKVDGLPKIAVKVTCDLSEEELGDVASAVRSSGVEGVIVSNTTIKRDLGLKSANSSQVGGLSGKPLFPLALQAVKTLRPLLPPSIPVIGCGGIASSSDAITMARAGAATVQMYTSFAYRGIGAPRLLKDEISADLVRDGKSWKSEIGADWADREMGWDEKRLEKESKALKEEAEDLGRLLRKSSEEKDTARLIKEVEAALSGKRVSQPDSSSTGGEAAEGGARDNLAGAQPGSPSAQPAGTPKAAEGGEKSAPSAASPTPTDKAVEAPQQGGVHVSEPLGGPLGPIVVQQVRQVDAPFVPKPSAFTGEVREGKRRLPPG
ncbi:putative Dihydroorotate dehydrogenase mitochondrial precursor [Dioszegia hungarica]|uniref:Dihydroorotate dehydrogenase (quinone), mitochondrial n=1 Tax=Dioszegia hungarica TaxID=4972 RepID=A0AA38LVL7_9TREE|nr:putative Dihydroorotate dehydrogenase mitochondrial precursor [Dioszegia hungarica]KAI9637500.1 putative Dihydroorotate dehydrogenase mitochondrial precursor [Dioszegia hungarica]